METEAVVIKAVEAFAGCVITWMFTQVRKLKKEREETQKRQELEIAMLKLGVQALLRDRIIQAYNHYVVEKGWIPIYAMDAIMACYKSYETLGENGVIDSLIHQLQALPNYDPKEGETHE